MPETVTCLYPVNQSNGKPPAPSNLVHCHHWLLISNNNSNSCSNNQPSATNKHITTRRESANKSKKPPQTQYTHDNSSMLTLCLLFNA